MIRLRWGRVLEIVAGRPGAIEVTVALEDGAAGHADAEPAIVYPDVVGPVRPGDRVLLNTTAVDLGLGTGGAHFVVAGERVDHIDTGMDGRTMKVRYTPQQVAVRVAEEEDSPHRAALERASGLEGTPVVWTPLHSMVAPVVAGARAAGAERVAYVMTGGAALPAPFSRVAAALRASGLLHAVITAGQAFGGDLETVTVFSGLLAARHVAGADVIVVGDGPGNTGTGTTWGASDVESATALNAAAVLGGRPVASLRVSFADVRSRHRGISHHSITALARVVMTSVHVAIPSIEDDARRAVVWDALRAAGLHERHQLVDSSGQPALDLLAEHGLHPESMGRAVEDDPEFFLAAGAAGVLAARMAAGDRRWRAAAPAAQEDA